MPEHPTLESILSQLQSHTPIQGLFLVTGERGAGKTTWLKKLITAARQTDYQVHGLLSPGTFENGEKVAINLINLANDETRVMTIPIETHLAAGHGGIRRLETGELVLGSWQVHEDTMQWGNQILFQLLTQSMSSDHSAKQILIIDELGPLEFVHGLGFTAAIQHGNRLNSIEPGIRQYTLSNRQPTHSKPSLPFLAAFIVVRPGLLPHAFTIWPEAKTIEIAKASP